MIREMAYLFTKSVFKMAAVGTVTLGAYLVGREVEKFNTNREKAV